MFLMIRLKFLTTAIFICPSSGQRVDDLEDRSLSMCSNFSNSKPLGWSFSYGIANLYPGDKRLSPTDPDYKLTPTTRGDFPIAADRNDPDNRFRNLKWNIPASEMKWMNSQNHRKAGQNVLFNDGHVAFWDHPFVGIDHDNIYTRANDTMIKGGIPSNRYDCVLLPTFPLDNFVVQ
jgi:prepilin-type processing-associated H-X9-DG protein